MIEKANIKEALNLNNNYKYITPYTLGLVMTSPNNCPIRVGDILISTISSNPSKDYVGTTWEAFGQGRCLVGVDTSDTDFNEVLKTGGSKYMQAHSHHIAGTWGASGHPPAPDGRVQSVNTNGEGWWSGYTENANVTTGDSGNLQPYITVYFWKRVS